MTPSPRRERLRADETLLQYCTEVARTDGALPTVKQLASHAHVSYVTMWRAVQRLVVAGAIEAAPRRGIRLVGGATPPHRSQSRDAFALAAPRYLQVKARILEDVCRGALGPGRPLGTILHMSRQYGVAYRTMRKAVEAGLGEAILAMQGGTVLVAAGDGRTHAPSSSRVVLIGRGSRTGELLHTPRTQRNLQALEACCAHHGLRLDVRVVDDRHRLLDTTGKVTGIDDMPGAVLGLVVWLTGILEPVRLGPIARQVEDAGGAVAVFDESGESTPLWSSSCGRTRFFTITPSYTAGVEMGRFLAVRGHRHMAFVSLSHSNQWSHERLRGLSAAMAEAGGEITAVTLNDIGYPAHTLERSRAVVDAAVRRATGGRKESPDGALLGEMLEDMRHPLTMALERTRLDRTVVDLVGPLLSRRDITAWVCENDRTALACMGLIRRGLLRPARMPALAGFDDSPEASLAKLTSYNFNLQGLAQSIVSSLVNPGLFERAGTRQHPIWATGIVVERTCRRIKATV